MGEIIIEIFSFFFDISYLRKKAKSGKRITWLEIIISPTVRLAIIVGIFLGLSIGIYRVVFDDSIKKKRTEKQMNEMVLAIDSYYNEFKVLPESINEIIGMRPLRKGWKMDEWQSQIILSPRPGDENLYELISFGPDKKFGTEDDIVIKGKKVPNKM